MHAVLYTLNGLLMIAMPLVLGRLLAAWRKVSWELFAVGAATFILSQFGHIPFNLVVQPVVARASAALSDQSRLTILAVFLGLSAGLFEEIARYLTYRYWASNARTWGKGMMLGAGHGGVEAILVGILTLLSFFILNAYRTEALPIESLADAERPILEAQIRTLFTAPWYATQLGAVERLFAIAFHLSASLLVMQSFVRGNGGPGLWLLAAVLWHALLNAVAVYAAFTWNAYVTEGLIGLLALGALFIIFWLRQPEPAEPPPAEPLPSPGPAEPIVLEVTAESLDRSRFD